MKNKIKFIVKLLPTKYADAKTDLTHKNAFELLVATILSAQCTDKRVNMVTPNLFTKYTSISDFAFADHKNIEKIIFSTGFYKNKARNLIGCAQKILNEYNGQVPDTMEKLITLPGVGRKTANCILNNYFIPVGIVIDTHVIRITNLLGIVNTKNALKIEQELMQLIPKEIWVNWTHYLIQHGRNTCIARRPKCNDCIIAKYCDSYECITKNNNN